MAPVIALTVVLSLAPLQSGAKLSNDAPVSQAEAYAVLSKVEDAMADALHTKHLARPTIDSGSNEPVSREVLVDEFQRIANGFNEFYKLTPRAQYLDASVLKLGGKRKEEAIRLIKLGYIDTLSPVVVGPKPTLSPYQFAVAVAYFTERWADRTHLPSIAYSPMLMPDAAPVSPANSGKPKGGQPSERPGLAPGAPAQHPA
jgi:hypothetical protein